jgi:hypothetical protein
MTKAFISLLALAAVASPAAAADGIRVNLVGKSSATIHADIARAALKVCFDQFSGSPLASYYIKSCRRDAVHEAEAALAVNVQQASAGKLASAR